MSLDQNAELRLERIESKIDQLSEAMIALARAEEKLVAIERTNNNHYGAIRENQNMIHEMQSEISDLKRSTATIQKMFWLVMTAVVTSSAAHFFLAGPVAH